MSDIDNLEPRRLYLRSLVEITGLEQTDFRWLTINVWKLTPTGEIPADSKPVVSFSEFIMQSINHMDRERLQIVPGVRDNAKIYFYDRELRQFSLQGFVYDIPFDGRQVAGGLRPYAFSTLRNLYNDKLRTSAATRQNLIVEFDYGQFRIYGTISNMSSTMTSDTPSIYVVTFVIVVEAVRVKDNTMPGSSLAGISQTAMISAGIRTIRINTIEQRLLGHGHANEARGILSREAARKIGLGLGEGADIGAYGKHDIVPKLTVGVEKALFTGMGGARHFGDRTDALVTKAIGSDQFPTKPVIIPQRKDIRL